MPDHDLSPLKQKIIDYNTIDPKQFDLFDVKRGLRNQDGSGVLAGLSRISSVIGTTKKDGVLSPTEGILKLRGIPIDDLMNQLPSRRFEATVFLLLVGELPSETELTQFCSILAENREVPADILAHVIQAIPSPNIMNKLQTTISALYTKDETADSLDPYENFLKSIRLIAKLPVIVGYAYLAAYVDNPTYVVPPAHLTQAESFLYVLNQGKESPAMDTDILDLCLALHAEHGGGNNSTFTTYVVSSSGSDIYSTLAAAVASLKGPLHGAANKKVMEMMDDIKANVSDWSNESDLTPYLTKILNKEAYDGSGKIYGLGHAVYTKSDPRAVSLNEKATALAKSKDRLDELNLYYTIANLGPKLFRDVKKSRKVISPNVDFFSGFVYDCLGIPTQVFTPIFAMARSAGWCAHRIEEIISGKRIIRPTYKYVG
jgi:citrate synthase